MKIAVAVDGSENALRAANYALMLVEKLAEAQLEIISVSDYKRAEEEQVILQSPRNLSLHQEKVVQPVIDKANEAEINSHVVLLTGHPVEEIVNYVNANQVSHLILGSRGLNTMQEMVLGSVSRQVMELANCPVTIIK